MITKEINENLDFSRKVSTLFEVARAQGWAFAAWKAPDATCIHVLLSQREYAFDDVDLAELGSGFCIAPFDASANKALFLNKDYYINSVSDRYISPGKEHMAQTIDAYVPEFPVATFPETLFAPPPHFSATEFKHTVAKGIAEIRKGTLKKVVVSRTLDIPVNKPDLTAVFMDLCASTHAFVSFASAPSLGIQIGASPEILVKTDGVYFKTVALAGTQKYVEGSDLYAASWTQKEIEEQALVSRYIIECFKKIRLREYEEIGPKTVRAGNILHLKTEFIVDMEALAFPQLPSVMLKLLHPTSAICGMPVAPAQEFIKANEKHDRAYFSGFLGAVN
ncbi:MAG TPA: chorismate-binding protein, partial [Cytophagales bacterium]|nr:chorismate-binding protein [Cytophagales bacterium]